MSASHDSGRAARPGRSAQEYVTVSIADQLFGLPLACVQDVFRLGQVTQVPLAPPDIAGVLNLRGRIVTVLDMRAKLGLPPAPAGARKTAVGIQWAGEFYGLTVDKVGDVARLSSSALQANPPHLDPRWAAMSEGVHQLDDALMIVLSIDRLLSGRRTPPAVRTPVSNHFEFQGSPA